MRTYMLPEAASAVLLRRYVQHCYGLHGAFTALNGAVVKSSHGNIRTSAVPLFSYKGYCICNYLNYRVQKTK